MAIVAGPIVPFFPSTEEIPQWDSTAVRVGAGSTTTIRTF